MAYLEYQQENQIQRCHLRDPLSDLKRKSRFSIDATATVPLTRARNFWSAWNLKHQRTVKAQIWGLYLLFGREHEVLKNLGKPHNGQWTWSSSLVFFFFFYLISILRNCLFGFCFSFYVHLALLMLKSYTFIFNTINTKKYVAIIGKVKSYVVKKTIFYYVGDSGCCLL